MISLVWLSSFEQLVEVFGEVAASEEEIGEGEGEGGEPVLRFY